MFVAFSSATCEVEGTSGCGLDTHFSGLVPGGSLAAAGAIVLQNHSDVALERSAGSEPTLVWEGYPSPTCFISSVCKEEGPCTAYESFPNTCGLESTPFTVAIGAQLVRWPAPILVPEPAGAPTSDLGTTPTPDIVVADPLDPVETYADTSEFVLGILATMGTLLGHLPGILGYCGHTTLGFISLLLTRAWEFIVAYHIDVLLPLLSMPLGLIGTLSPLFYIFSVSLMVAAATFLYVLLVGLQLVLGLVFTAFALSGYVFFTFLSSWLLLLLFTYHQQGRGASVLPEFSDFVGTLYNVTHDAMPAPLLSEFESGSGFVALAAAYLVAAVFLLVHTRAHLTWGTCVHVLLTAPVAIFRTYAAARVSWSDAALCAAVFGGECVVFRLLIARTSVPGRAACMARDVGTFVHQRSASRWVFLVLLAYCQTAAAVCPHCNGYGANRTCEATKAEDCKTLVSSTANAILMAGLAAGTALSGRTFDVKDCLPYDFFVGLPRNIIEALRLAAALRPGEKSLDITDPAVTPQKIIELWKRGSVSGDDVCAEIATRIVSMDPAKDSAKISQLETVSKLVSARSDSSRAPGDMPCSDDGFALLAYATAVKLVTSLNSRSVCHYGAQKLADSLSRAVTIELKRATTEWEFAEVMHVWQMLATAFGYMQYIVLSTFLREVVFLPMRGGQFGSSDVSWEVAQEHLLVHLREIQSKPGCTFANCLSRGNAQSLLDMAMNNLLARSPGRYIFRTAGIELKSGKARDPGGASEDDGAVKFKGHRSVPDTMPVCLSFNQNNPHPPRSLDKNGYCKYRAVCDRWIVDGDKGQRANWKACHATGSDCKGPRDKCTNPGNKQPPGAKPPQ